MNHKCVLHNVYNLFCCLNPCQNSDSWYFVFLELDSKTKIELKNNKKCAKYFNRNRFNESESKLEVHNAIK